MADNNKLNRLILLALMIALSFVGANIKLPGPFSTIALDSFPAYFAGILMGGFYGGFVGLMGHLMTSALSGFPFGLPIHGAIALLMFLSVYLFALASKKVHSILGIIVAIAMNGLVMPVALVTVPGFEWEMAVVFIPALVVASAVNVTLAVVINGAVSKTELARGFKDDDL